MAVCQLELGGCNAVDKVLEIFDARVWGAHCAFKTSQVHYLWSIPSLRPLHYMLLLHCTPNDEKNSFRSELCCSISKPGSAGEGFSWEVVFYFVRVTLLTRKEGFACSRIALKNGHQILCHGLFSTTICVHSETVWC